MVPRPATVVLAAGKVIVVLSVPAKVRLLFAVSVLPSAIVSVEPVAGAVKATLLMLVAEATPSVGVTSVGLVASTLLPEPVLVTLTTFLLASKASAVDAVRPESVVVPETVTFVNDAEPPVLLILMKSEPFQAIKADSPATMVTPVVGPAPTTFTE